MSTDLAVWIGAILTIGVYSFLYKENPFYRFVEHAFIGLGSGYALVMGYTNIINKAWTPLSKGRIEFLIPVALGLMLFGRFAKGLTWTARIPLAFVIGMGSAIALRGSVQAEFVQQIQAAMTPINSLDNLLTLVGTLGVLAFFLFTVKQENVLMRSANYVGRVTMMLCFGAIFASGIMLRISLFIGILQFMFGKWILLIK
ncbi:MAG: hypothetical protein Q8P50_03955 [Bacillota bacterium]|nr:hypothetical protein [Bacillota bacterium]